MSAPFSTQTNALWVQRKAQNRPSRCANAAGQRPISALLWKQNKIRRTLGFKNSLRCTLTLSGRRVEEQINRLQLLRSGETRQYLSHRARLAFITYIYPQPPTGCALSDAVEPALFIEYQWISHTRRLFNGLPSTFWCASRTGTAL
jgi:hypothetical protein